MEIEFDKSDIFFHRLPNSPIFLRDPSQFGTVFAIAVDVSDSVSHVTPGQMTMWGAIVQNGCSSTIASQELVVTNEENDLNNISQDTLLEAIWSVLNAPGAEFDGSASSIEENDTLSELYDDLHQDMQRILEAVGDLATGASEVPAPIFATTPMMQMAEEASLKG